MNCRLVLASFQKRSTAEGRVQRQRSPVVKLSLREYYFRKKIMQWRNYLLRRNDNGYDPVPGEFELICLYKDPISKAKFNN